MKKLIVALGFVLITCVLPVFVTSNQASAVGTANTYKNLCDPASPNYTPSSILCKQADQKGLTEIIQIIVKTLFFLIGVVAVIMIIFGGIRYVLSGGDSNAVSAAKNIILYSAIGVVVAMLGYALVDFVVTRFSS